jgi:Ca-activated chloride channel homolog
MPFFHFSSTVLAMALIAAPFRPLASPQVTMGRIAGVIKDATSGTGIANVRVLIVGTTLNTQTDGSGGYRFDAVPVGTYTIAIRAVGYTPVTLSGQIVQTGRTTQLDVTLQPGATQLEAVIVTGAAKARRDAVGLVSPITIQGYAGPLRSIQPGVSYEPGDREQYDPIEENAFFAAAARPLSTFSIDVDRASYANMRRFLLQGIAPPKDAVRLEELVNYFPYEYREPRDDAPVAINAEVGDAPWHARHRLVRIGLQARRVEMRNAPAANFVFLIDVSGSMADPNKLPLLKRAFGLLVEQLRPRDRVAIVVYAGSAGLVLPSTPGSDKAAIIEAIGRLEAGGSTAGGEGIRRAYDEAVKNFVRGGNNRVILATDGDFNVGVSSDAEMVRLVEEKRKTGVFLTVLGFGEGNLQDAKMEKLADHGNGNYAYIDNLLEARKVLVHELGGTLYTVAKDVKIQVEFNPAQVRAYRLIGYENRLLADEDFTDDKKDAGEIGSGHSVTALYELIPVGVESDVNVRVPDSLRYQTPASRGEPRDDHGELLFVKVRYKAPDGDTSRLLSFPVRDPGGVAPSLDFRFQAAVAEFGLLLRESKHRGRADWGRVIAAARESLGRDSEGYRAEFVRLAQAASALTLTNRDR